MTEKKALREQDYIEHIPGAIERIEEGLPGCIVLQEQGPRREI